MRLRPVLCAALVLSAAALPAADKRPIAETDLFRFVWLGGQYRRRFKAWNRKAYYVAKFGLIVVGVALIVYL